MSDFRGGFILERSDPEAGAVVHRVVRSHLREIGERVKGRHLAFAFGGGRALFVEVTGRDRPTSWHLAHAALAGKLAETLGCRAWAWGEENQVGSEFVIAFDPDGKKKAERHFARDDTPKAKRTPLGDLARELGAWVDVESDSRLEQPLGSAFDPAILEDYLLVVTKPKANQTSTKKTKAKKASTKKSASGGARFSCFLTQNLFADATRLAAAAGSDVGSVLAAAWELSKEQLSTKNGVAAFPSREAALFPSPSKKAPKLSTNKRPTPELVTLALPASVAREVQAMARELDVKYGLPVDAAYALAREKLWRGD